MSDDHAPDRGDAVNLTVRVSPSQVHKAVQNVLKNEMGLDAEFIEGRLASRIDGVLEGLAGAAKKKVDEAVAHLVKCRLNEMVRKFADEKIAAMAAERINALVAREFRERMDEAIEVVFKDGMEINVGWKSRIVKIVKKEGPDDEKDADDASR